MTRHQTFINNVAFLDFEASSLDKDSWPIEVGLSWINPGLGVETFASLICPAADWPEAAWSPMSAEIHNIPRRDLDHAPDVRTVAKTLLDVLGNRIALSDAPAFELHWLGRLLDAADMTHKVDVLCFDAVTMGSFSARALDHLFERLELTRVPHRAGPDSARLAKSWCAGLLFDRSSS